MGKRLDNVASDQREMLEKSRHKVLEYQTEVDLREQDIQKLTKEAE